MPKVRSFTRELFGYSYTNSTEKAEWKARHLVGRLREQFISLQRTTEGHIKPILISYIARNQQQTRLLDFGLLWSNTEINSSWSGSSITFALKMTPGFQRGCCDSSPLSCGATRLSPYLAQCGLTVNNKGVFLWDLVPFCHFYSSFIL